MSVVDGSTVVVNEVNGAGVARARHSHALVISSAPPCLENLRKQRGVKKIVLSRFSTALPSIGDEAVVEPTGRIAVIERFPIADEAVQPDCGVEKIDPFVGPPGTEDRVKEIVGIAADEMLEGTGKNEAMPHVKSSVKLQ